MSIPIIPIIRIISGVDPSIHPIHWSIEWQILLHSSKVVPALFFYFWLMIIASRFPRSKNLLDSFIGIFKNALNGIITGRFPEAEGGILVENNLELEDNSQPNEYKV
jgi:hypothetical protein